MADGCLGEICLLPLVNEKDHKMKRHLLIPITAVLLAILWGYSRLEAQTVAALSEQPGSYFQTQEREEKIALKTLLRALEKEYQVFFTYSDKIVEGKEVAYRPASGQKLEEVLARALPSVGLQYQKVRGKFYVITEKTAGERPARKINNGAEKMRSSRQIPVMPLLSYQPPRYPQPQLFPVNGTVTDQAGEPLVGVNVLVKGNSLGTITDINGAFSLDLPDGEQSLVFSYVGYETLEVPVNGRSQIEAVLRESATALDEVVVVGYGSMRKSDLTGSVSKIKAADIHNQPIYSVEQGLQGRAAGVQITQSSSEPGGGISVRIRGGNSVNGGNEPLYVIDGFPVINNNGRAAAGGNPGTGGISVAPNGLASLNPNDIESIEVLKDASATAIYGARAANGVVLITTKRGKSGKAKVNVDIFSGIQELAKSITVLNAAQYGQWANEVAAARGEQPYFTDVSSLGEGTNAQDAIYQTGSVQNYQVSVSGGNEQTRYHVSGNFFDQKGIIKNSGFERYSLRMNLDQKISDRINIGNSLFITRTDQQSVLSGGSGNKNAGVSNAAFLWLPVFPLEDENGGFFQHENGTPPEILPLPLSNPLALVNEVQDQLVSDRILGNLFLEYEILRGLKFRSSFGVDMDKRNRDIYFTRKTLRGGNGVNGLARVGNSAINSLLNENILTYQTSIGQHKFNVLAGYTRQSETFEDRIIQTNNFVNDITGTNNLDGGAPPGGPSVASSKRKWSLASYLGRVNYILSDKYLFTFNIRADGSSKFGADNRWGVFPSAAFAWRIIDEDFMDGVNLLSDLKARVSYGETGNQEIGEYQSQAILRTTGYPFGGLINTGFYTASLANPGLRWETTTQLDVGLDLGAFNNRITLSMDYYQKRTEDLLLAVTLPQESGFNTALKNSGIVENKGFELSLGADPLAGPIKWHTDLNFSMNRNTVVDLGESTRIFGSTISFDYKIGGSLVEVGQPLGVFFGYQVEGPFRNQAEIEAHGAQPAAAPGDLKFVDTNGDGEINSLDRTIIGDPTPDYIFGWNNRLAYKNFSLNFFIQGVQGADILNVNLRNLESSVSENNITVDRFVNRWTPQNPDALYPRAGATNFAGDDLTSNLIEDGSYIRLNNITLGYRFGSGKLGAPWIRGLELNVSAQNLFTITDYKGFNPDVNSQGQNNINQGIDFGAYPLAKTYIIGLKFEL